MSKTSISGSFPILIYSIPSMKNLIVRSLSGAIYVALIVCSILFGGGWAFPVLCCIFTFTGILEFQKMTQTDFYDSPRMLFVDLLIGLAIPAIVAMSFCGLPMLAILTGIATIILALTRLITQLYSHRENPLRHIAYSIMSVTYLAFPLAAATGILFIDRGILLLMFVMIWLNDTGAFLVGSAIGRPPTVSAPLPQEIMGRLLRRHGILRCRRISFHGAHPRLLRTIRNLGDDSIRHRGLHHVYVGRPVRVHAQTHGRGQGQRKYHSRSWRYPRPHRLPAVCSSGHIGVLDHSLHPTLIHRAVRSEITRLYIVHQSL